MAAAAPAWLEDYLRYLATQRRAAALTLEHYRRDLARLHELAAPRHPDLLAAHDIRGFVARLHAGGLAPRSLARVLSAWRGFFRWRMRQHGLAANPVQDVRAPRAPRLLPKALSPDQAQALLDAAPDNTLEVRDRAMFELFYASGLRLSELAGLPLKGGVDQAARLVTVRGKRDKPRSVPVGQKALDALGAWLALRGQWPGGDDAPLFVTRSGGRMSPGAIRARLARWAQAHGLGMHVHPHMLRHSFASHLLQSSGDLRAVQELLGHASVRSTQIYTHLDFQHLARVYDAAHPLARKR